MEPQLKTIRLPQDLSRRVDESLARGETGTLVLHFEILQLDPTGRALVWFRCPTPRIGVLQLDFATTWRSMETLLPTEIESRWTVLGKKDDEYVVAQWQEPQLVGSLHH